MKDITKFGIILVFFITFLTMVYYGWLIYKLEKIGDRIYELREKLTILEESLNKKGATKK